MTKLKFTVEIEFENWSSENKTSKNEKEWNEFLQNHFCPESSVIGVMDDEEGDDLIALNTIEINNIEIL
jgi:hypothetical protein